MKRFFTPVNRRHCLSLFRLFFYNTFAMLSFTFLIFFFSLSLFNAFDGPIYTFSYYLSSTSNGNKESSFTSSIPDKSTISFQKSTQFNEAVQQYIHFIETYPTYQKYSTSIPNKNDPPPQDKNNKETSLPISSFKSSSRFWNHYLKPMLVPRIPGTPSHQRVRDFLKHELSLLGFEVQLHSVKAMTPLGMKTFSNIIATRFSKAPLKFIWSAHYDSKDLKSSSPFLGATDSAASCALLLELAARMKPIWDQFKTSRYAIQLVFFDGEEAMNDWSSTDSIYGAKGLAEAWDRNNTLKDIQVMLLLDLLGAKDLRLDLLVSPHHPTNVKRNVLKNTLKENEKEETKINLKEVMKPELLFHQLVTIETQLRESKLIHDTSLVNTMFNSKSSPRLNYIEDDHLPFQAKGVPILHLIPLPFPTVWHQPEDNEEALHPETLENLLMIFTGLAYTLTIHA